MLLLAKLYTLFSGSSGNSTYIGSNDDTGILIDAGRSAKQIENALSIFNINSKRIQAIFVTHEHTDHIKGIKVLASRYNIPVYSSMGTIKAMEEMNILNGKFKYGVIDEKGICIGGMFIVPFRTSHDSRESVGYKIRTQDYKEIVIAMDIGVVSDDVRHALNGCDLAVIESNHDINMLKSGSYPYFLKRRILSSTGHLSNDDCAKELPDLVRSGVKKFILAHLSSENNVENLALATAVCSLNAHNMKKGIDFDISVAPKEMCCGAVVI